MSEKFSIGDRVIVNGMVDGRVFKEDIGTIINMPKFNGGSIGVEFERYIDGHSCGGSINHGRYGHCWNVEEENIKKYVEEIEPVTGEFQLGGFVKYNGMIGKIVLLEEDKMHGVEFFESRAGFHTLGNTCENGHGYYCWEENLTKVQAVSRIPKIGEYIVITDARPSFEQDYKVGDVFVVTKINELKDAVWTTKYPDNCILLCEFMALEDIVETPEEVIPEVPNIVEELKPEKTNSFKMKCVSNIGNGDLYINGKIYEVVNGYFTNERGTSVGFNEECDSFEEWQEFSASIWELVTGEEEVELKSNVNFEAFQENQFCVHCDTKEKAEAFLKECDEHYIKWASGDKASEWNANWSFNENTYYVYDDGLLMGSVLNCSKEIFIFGEEPEVFDQESIVPFVIGFVKELSEDDFDQLLMDVTAEVQRRLKK